MSKFLVILLLFLCCLMTISAQNNAVTLVGQVVCCEDCWVEKKKGQEPYGDAEDLLKSQSCFAKGDEPLLAVGVGKDSKLYKIESGKSTLTKKEWQTQVGRKISAVGFLKKVKKQEVFYIDSFEILEKSIAEQDSQKVIGMEVELKLKDLFGVEQSLAQLKGRIVILNFWATYCLPCRAEMPDLSAIQNDYAAFGVQVIGASTDELEDKPKILQFIKEVKVNFPIWIGATSADTLKFGVGTALPATIIINREGKIIKTISGVINPAELRKFLDESIKESEKIAQKQEKNAKKSDKNKVSSVPS